MVLVPFEFCLLFPLTDLSTRVITWLNKNSHGRSQQPKNRNNTSQSKNLRIIAWKLNLEWEHLFWTFLTWLRRKNNLGGLVTGMKEKTEQTAYNYNYSLRVAQHGNWNKACFWIISALKSQQMVQNYSPYPYKSLKDFASILSKETFLCDGQFSNMSGLSYLTCVKLN